MRKSIVVVSLIVSIVLALAVGTAVASDNSANEGEPQEHGHHKGSNKGSGNGAADDNQGSGKGAAQTTNEGSANGAVQLANKTTLTSNQPSNKVNGENSAQEVSFVFKGTLAQDGVQDSPLQVKVEKANEPGQSFVAKDLKINTSSDTEIYRDNADEQNPKLDAKISDLKAGDEVMLKAKGAPEATSFTASMISAQPPSNTADTHDTAAAPDTVVSPSTNKGSLSIPTNKNP